MEAVDTPEVEEANLWDDQLCQEPREDDEECAQRAYWEEDQDLGSLRRKRPCHEDPSREVPHGGSWEILPPRWLGLQEAEHRKRFLKKLRDEEPDSILLSPPCRLWSQLQELAASRSEEARDDLRLRREEDHDTILTFIAVVYEEQRRNGRDATCEHPWMSKAWKTKAFTKMQGYDTYVDQCQYKLKLPDEHGVVRPVRKPTCFRTTGPVIYDLLWANCDEGHTHTPLEGNIPGVGPRSSKLAEDYTQQLAAKLAEAMVAQYNAGTEAYAAEDVESHNQGADVELNIPEHVAKNRTLKQKVGRRAVEYVQRLHKNMGHISSEVLVRMLTEVQATDNVLQAAREYVCPTCYARQQLPQVPPSSALKTTEFNQRIQVDTHWILCEQSAVREREVNPGTPAGRRRERGELTGRQCVMTIVDHATRYCAIRILKSEAAEEFRKGLERCWFKHFGVPKYLRMDEAKGWSSKHVREWCASRGIAIEVQPAEQHSWLGVVERKHQVVRRALELYQDDLGRHDIAALKEAAIYVPHTINQMSMVRGFTPQQWVLGKTMTNVHGLTSEIFNPGQEPLDDSGAFAQVQQRRVRAQTAWIKADTDAKLRRAFNQKFVEVKEQVVVGQRCWYWRGAGSGILQKAKWRGPARVVAIEEHDSARVIWICHGTSLVRCSDRQVRPLVEETGTIVEVDHKAALKDLEDLKARSTTQYKDELQADGGPDLEMNDEDDHPGDPDSDPDYAPTTDEDEDGPDGATGLRTSELPGVISMMIPRPLDRSDRERTPRGSEGGRSAETEVPETPLFDPETPRDDEMDPLTQLRRSVREHSPKRKSEETTGKLARRRKDPSSASTTTTRPPVIVEEEIPQDTEPSSEPEFRGGWWTCCGRAHSWCNWTAARRLEMRWGRHWDGRCLLHGCSERRSESKEAEFRWERTVCRGKEEWIGAILQQRCLGIFLNAGWTKGRGSRKSDHSKMGLDMEEVGKDDATLCGTVVFMECDVWWCQDSLLVWKGVLSWTCSTASSRLFTTTWSRTWSMLHEDEEECIRPGWCPFALVSGGR